MDRTKKQTYAALLASSIYRQIHELSSDAAWKVVGKWSNVKVEQFLKDHPRQQRPVDFRKFSE